jgi:putative transposase
VDSESYLLEVCRYVDLNPVRAKMVERPDAYAWSSYRALVGLDKPVRWLDAQAVYDQLCPGKSLGRAARVYAEFVADGHGVRLWDESLKQQIYLGDDVFITRMQAHSGVPGGSRSANISKVQKSAPPLDVRVEEYARVEGGFGSKAERNKKIAQAFFEGGHSQTAIARAFEVSGSTVSRVILTHEADSKIRARGRYGKREG